MLLALLASCAGAPTVDDTAAVPPMEHLFSFAVIADPHITANVSHQERLASAVAWINANADARGIELVFVVGDIGWGEGLPVARALLDGLSPTWVPLLGDNEVHFGAEQAFDEVFASQYDALVGELEGWRRGQVEVHNPVYGRTSWLQNLSFDHRGLRMVGLDWCSRNDNDLLSELAELNDFEGGSLPFLAHELGAIDAGPQEDVLLFSHHPMHLGSFNLAQMEAITGLTGPIAGRVAGAWAGHVHVDAEIPVEDGGYTVWVTDATFDDDNTVRVVEVDGNGLGFAYRQELVVVD